MARIPRMLIKAKKWGQVDYEYLLSKLNSNDENGDRLIMKNYV